MANPASSQRGASSSTCVGCRATPSGACAAAPWGDGTPGTLCCGQQAPTAAHTVPHLLHCEPAKSFQLCLSSLGASEDVNQKTRAPEKPPLQDQCRQEECKCRQGPTAPVPCHAPAKRCTEPADTPRAAGALPTSAQSTSRDGTALSLVSQQQWCLPPELLDVALGADCLYSDIPTSPGNADFLLIACAAIFFSPSCKCGLLNLF